MSRGRVGACSSRLFPANSGRWATPAYGVKQCRGHQPPGRAIRYPRNSGERPAVVPCSWYEESRSRRSCTPRPARASGGSSDDLARVPFRRSLEQGDDVFPHPRSADLGLDSVLGLYVSKRQDEDRVRFVDLDEAGRKSASVDKLLGDVLGSVDDRGRDRLLEPQRSTTTRTRASYATRRRALSAATEGPRAAAAASLLVANRGAAVSDGGHREPQSPRLRAHRGTAGLCADRRVRTSKRVRTRTIARVAKHSRC